MWGQGDQRRRLSTLSLDDVSLKVNLWMYLTLIRCNLGEQMSQKIYQSTIEDWEKLAKTLDGELSIPIDRDGLKLGLSYTTKKYTAYLVSSDLWPNNIHNLSYDNGNIKSSQHTYIKVNFSESDSLSFYLVEPTLLRDLLHRGKKHKLRTNKRSKAVYFSPPSQIEPFGILNTLQSMVTAYDTLEVRLKEGILEVSINVFLGDEIALQKFMAFVVMLTINIEKS